MMNVSTLTRDDCVMLLESICIQCYDHESIETLREAVAVNIEDGTLDADLLPEKARCDSP